MILELSSSLFTRATAQILLSGVRLGRSRAVRSIDNDPISSTINCSPEGPKCMGHVSFH